MLGSLFHKRQHNETEELIRNTRFDNILDAFDEKVGQ